MLQMLILLKLIIQPMKQDMVSYFTIFLQQLLFIIEKFLRKNTIKNRLKIQKNERKIALEKQKKLALEKEKQRLAEIPSTIREVDEQITKMLDNTNQ